MAEEKARRRVRGHALNDDIANGKEQYQAEFEYDDQGKDAYSKPSRNFNPQFASGRMPQPPPPPPTSIVHLVFSIVFTLLLT